MLYSLIFDYCNTVYTEWRFKFPGLSKSMSKSIRIVWDLFETEMSAPYSFITKYFH